MHFKVVGSAPNRKLVIEWQNMQITRGAGCAGVGTGTFQVWLFEPSHSTSPGVIEFVYGALPAAASVDAGYSVGLQSGAATNFASVTTSVPSVSYTTANNAQLDAISAGTAYLFTPNVPGAPTDLTFTNVTAISMTLNWIDNATNEVGYAIYQSTDDDAFVRHPTRCRCNFAGDQRPDSEHHAYHFRVFAVTEGALSSALSGSQATNPTGAISCTGAGGNWS